MAWIDNLKKIMADKGFNIEKLKNAIASKGYSLSRNSIGNILNGKNSPKVDTLKVIAEAMQVQLQDIFSLQSEQKGSRQLNGFIEYNGEILKISSKNELKQLYETVFGITEKVTEKKEPEIAALREDYLVRSLIAKGRTRNSSLKLKSHVYPKYHITISSRRELEAPNDLPRDARIWIFRSRDEEQKARALIKRVLNFEINT